MVAVLVDKSCVVADNVDPAVSVVGQVNEAVLIPVGACVKKISKKKHLLQIRKDSARRLQASKKTFITNSERFCTYVASKQKHLLEIRKDSARTLISWEWRRKPSLIWNCAAVSFLVLPPMIPLKPSKMVEWAESVYPPMNILCISSKLECVAVGIKKNILLILSDIGRKYNRNN